MGGAYALPPDVWQDLEDEALDTGGVEERAHEAGIAHVEAVAELGDPVNRIVTAAEEHDVSLVVVGAHDKGFLRRLVDPSVSHAVLRHTQRPVLVVHEEHVSTGGAAGTTGPEAADTGGGASA
jgi:nucleotide-binding universal stress UspA family protein